MRQKATETTTLGHPRDPMRNPLSVPTRLELERTGIHDPITAHSFIGKEVRPCPCPFPFPTGKRRFDITRFLMRGRGSKSWSICHILFLYGEFCWLRYSTKTPKDITVTEKRKSSISSVQLACQQTKNQVESCQSPQSPIYGGFDIETARNPNPGIRSAYVGFNFCKLRVQEDSGDQCEGYVGNCTVFWLEEEAISKDLLGRYHRFC